MPSSSVGFIPSSPPELQPARPTLQRTQSTVSERAPLSTVPTITLSENGDPVVMGRSSTSCDYALRGNSLISRIHARVRYIPAPSVMESNKIEIHCVGYNGMTVHCRGRAWKMAEDERFISDEEHVEIMLDIQNSRVSVAWPVCERKRSPPDSDSTWYEESSPRQAMDTLPSSGGAIGSSPLRHGARLRSPVSPSPAGHAHFPTSSTFLPSEPEEDQNAIAIYEDEDVSDDDQDDQELPGPAELSRKGSELTNDEDDYQSSSELSEPQSEFLDHNEENDPIIHAFGPSGENILPRMASLPTGASPDRSPIGSQTSLHVAASEEDDKPDNDALANHIINQLAFSRTQSTPMSTLLANLPSEFKRHSSSWNERNLKDILTSALCIGEISREGKDAAGKALENEFYYVPEKDVDQDRRAAIVEALGKPSLRSCRKQHKVGLVDPQNLS
ncbi:hypothetical protein GP486_001256 [Trichoglossum hirsutum]|uniref:FHA domain-containing protein n=1 Tax=Trichoglossum hirsutum TaxID=265104 RepID=A0A9P8LH92_9PEZI|nr:hypothetical protein GP486_001256 [Trichoglossum hirsutum]